MMNSYEGEMLASYALFRELYNNNCKNIYDIVVEFVRDIIVTQCRYSFTLNEITNLVNKTFGFQIPDYVIAPSVMKIEGIVKKEGVYCIKMPISNRNILFEKNQNDIINQNKQIISDLYTYVKQVKGITLSEKEKNILQLSFYGFLLDEMNGNEYTQHISAFIIKNSSNSSFVKQLDSIREGVVLYTGINYNNRINEVGSWKNDLTIYLEMEILFHIAGYNGVIFKELADEMLTLIYSARNAKSKRLIKLRYFNETKNQLERFFDKAEYIVNGQSILDSDNIAMKEIINGCKSISDVNDKKSDFYTLLNNKGIILDDEDNYYNTSLTQYNLEDAATLEDFASDDDEDSEEVFKRLKFISNINKLRKGQVKGDYADCGYLLVTNTTKTLKMSKTLSYQNKTVPYAVNMATLTNLLWNRLNIGFGAKDFPKSIDVIIKAQIILSKFVNDSVGESYLKLRVEYKSSKITEEQMLSRLAGLRNLVKKPDDISINDLDDTLLLFTEDKIEQYLQEQEMYKSKVIESEIRSSELEQAMKNYKTSYENLKKKIEMKNKIEIKVSKLNKINEETSKLQQLKENLELKASKKYRIFKICCFMGVIMFYGFYITEIIRRGWDNMEKITYLLSLFPIIVSAIFSFITSKSINLITSLNLVKDKYRMKAFKNNENLDEYINKNIAIINNLKIEIDNLFIESNIFGEDIDIDMNI